MPRILRDSRAKLKIVLPPLISVVESPRSTIAGDVGWEPDFLTMKFWDERYSVRIEIDPLENL
jgi:hypothetical protein